MVILLEFVNVQDQYTTGHFCCMITVPILVVGSIGTYMWNGMLLFGYAMRTSAARIGCIILKSFSISDVQQKVFLSDCQICQKSVSADVPILATL